ncbi:hypothetical protein DITRI_Ditri06bG0104800 [Diplodiscus trichospermus]
MDVLDEMMIPPITTMMVNLIAIAVGFSRTIYSLIPQWNRLLGGFFFSFWVLAHLYPFTKGLTGRRGRTPTIVFVWSGLIAITVSLLWVVINSPSVQADYAGEKTRPCSISCARWYILLACSNFSEVGWDPANKLVSCCFALDCMMVTWIAQ